MMRRVDQTWVEWHICQVFWGREMSLHLWAFFKQRNEHRQAPEKVVERHCTEYLSLFNLEAMLLLPFSCLLRSLLQPVVLAGSWLLEHATQDPLASPSNSWPPSEVFFFAPAVPSLTGRPAFKPVSVTKPELHLCQIIHFS